MANVTIPNLPSASNIVPSTDLLVLEQTNGTRKATIDQIFVNANLPTITYSTWQGYTDEQKEDFVGYISGVPDETLNASSIAYDGTTSGSSNTNVQDELDTLNSNLSNPIVEDIQNLYSYFSKNVGGYIKVGKIVILNVSIKTITSLVAGGSYQLGSIPAPIAPLTLTCIDNHHDYKISATVDSNGVITFINNENSQITSDRIFISGAYVSAN